MNTNYLVYYRDLSNEILHRLIVEQKIKQKVHPVYENLRVFKYHPKFDFFANDKDTRWVEVCRGLVWDWDKQEIVANPMPKFHNHFTYSKEELETLFMQHQYTVENKYDGSCVLLWQYDNNWHWSTLGSFESEQAKKAKEIFESEFDRNGYDYIFALMTANMMYTYIFEIIYPENRVVLDYEGDAGMIHITTRHRDTGAEIRGRPFSPAIKKSRARHITLSKLLKYVESNEFREGHVVKFYPEEVSSPLTSPYLGVDGVVGRIKFKTEWYFKHSRIKQFYQSSNLVKNMIAYEKGDLELTKDLKEAMAYMDLEPLTGYVDELSKDVRAKALEISGLHKERPQQAKYIKSLEVHPRIRAALFCGLDSKWSKMRELVWKSFEGHETEIKEACARTQTILKS